LIVRTELFSGEMIVTILYSSYKSRDLGKMIQEHRESKRTTEGGEL
jgi:hypothetical protein